LSEEFTSNEGDSDTSSETEDDRTDMLSNNVLERGNSLSGFTMNVNGDDEVTSCQPNETEMDSVTKKEKKKKKLENQFRKSLANI